MADPPLVFTEHGTLMSSQPHLAAKLAELERSLENLDRETREQFAAVKAAIQALTQMASTRRSIGLR